MKNKILIIDDEPNILMSLEYTFKKNNFEVYVARDGLEAIEILQNLNPNIVLLDIMMPNIDGFETLSYIKSQNNLKTTKVIFLSAKSKEKEVKKGIDAGADFYITKPFSMKYLTEKVYDLIK